VLCDNSNLSYKGKALSKFLNPNDNFHLSQSGIAMLASNIRDCIDHALGLPKRTQRKSRDYPNINARHQDVRYQNSQQNFDDYAYGSHDYQNNGGGYNRDQRVNYRRRGQNFRSHRGYPGRRY